MRWNFTFKKLRFIFFDIHAETRIKINFRRIKRQYTGFAMLAETQTLEGVSSLLEDGRHVVFWDLEGCTLQEAEETLGFVQRKYNLSHIYIVSDIEGSYRAWCFSKITFKTLLQILLDTDYVDYKFFYYTVKRRKATLRTDVKKDRPPQRLVAVLESYPETIPKRMEKVVYDTGIVKRGTVIVFAR